MIAKTVIHLRRTGLFLSQFLHRGMGQVMFAFKLPVVRQHQSVTQYVVRRRKQAAAGLGESMNAISVGFRQVTNPAPSVSGLVLAGTVGAREPRNLRVARPEGCFGHSQWIKKTFLQKLLVPYAAHDLDNARI